MTPTLAARPPLLPPAGVLRPYQERAVAQTLQALQAGHHPVLSLPTGAGKSFCIAALCAHLEGRILCATHRSELIAQDAEKLEIYSEGQEDFGIYSAGLRLRETSPRVVFAGIGSIYRRMDALQAAGPFAYVITDENHLVPPRSVKSMYRSVFEACPIAQRIGLTATPFRLSGGLIYKGPDAWYDVLAVHLGIRDLTPAYLAPLVGVLTASDIDTSLVHTRAGEFVQGELSQVACEEQAVKGAIEELCALAAARKKWLIFAVDVAHATLVTYALQQRGIAAALVTGETPREKRRTLLEDFRTGAVRAMTNVEVLTTGFDLPDIDCVILLRPTKSRGLFLQMIGRGTRKAPGKTDALLLDFSGGVERFSPLDDLSSLMASPQRQAKDAKRAAKEAQERREEAARLAKHATRASLADPMGTRTPDRPPQRYRVERVTYAMQKSSRPPFHPMLLVTLYCPERLGQRTITQFVCVEHDGWARQKAIAWFLRRRLPVPKTARAALRLVWQAPQPTHVVVKDGGKFPEVLMEEFAEESEVQSEELFMPGQ